MTSSGTAMRTIATSAAAERARRRRRLRMVPVAAGAWAAAFVAVQLPSSAGLLAVVSWAAVCLGGGLVLACGRFGILVLVLAGAAAVCSQVGFAQPVREQALLASGEHLRDVDVRIVSKVEPGRNDTWHADALLLGDDWAAPVRVTWRDAGTGHSGPIVDIGVIARITGTATPTAGGDRAVLSIWADVIEPRAPAPPALAVAAELRDGLVAQAAGMPGDGGQLLPGLAVGDTRLVDARLDSRMTVTGLTHLLAVSGANCAVVAALGWGVGWVFALRRSLRVALAAGALVGFVLLVTPEPSVVRASMMAGLGMIAVLCGRGRDGVALLSVAVVVALVIDPWLATSIGFALSVAATAALLLIAPTIAARLRRWLPSPIAFAVAIPVAAQLACAPLLVLLDPAVSIVSVLANLVAAPAAPIATVAGLVACVLAGVPVLGTLATAVAWVPAAWIAGTAEAAAVLPVVRMPWPGGLGGAIALGIVCCALVCAVVVRDGRLRAAAVVVSSLVTGLAAGAVVVDVVVERAPGDWSIALCDVGQGDAVVLRSADAVMLVDTGPDAVALESCLSRLGIVRVDLLVLTHGDADHVGGVDAVSGRVDVVLHGPTDADTAALIDRIRAASIVRVTAGDAGVIGGAAWRVLWPSRGVSTPGNDASVVLEVAGGGLPRTLLLGDLGADAQRAVLATGAIVGPYDVVKVAHHGSADQEPRLYVSAAASVALIGVGAENDYGHPTATLLDVLRDVRAVVARSDADGLVLVRVDADRVTLWREDP